jgi:hypothetical protein
MYLDMFCISDRRKYHIFLIEVELYVDVYLIVLLQSLMIDIDVLF